MKTSDFYYELPKELIAQTPIEPRDHSRLLVLNRQTGAVSHRHFYDIIDYLHEGDLIVANDSRVLPARIYGIKDGTSKTKFDKTRNLYPLFIDEILANSNLTQIDGY